MLSWRKEHVVTAMVEEYLVKSEQCLGLFKMAFEAFLQHGPGPKFDELVDKTHIAESSCDDIRRRIEEAMYEKALIPESRGDILNLLEKMDKLPNKAERTLFQVQIEALTVPESYRASFRRLVHANCECFDAVAQAVRLLFTEPGKIRALASEIDKKESAIDHLELDMIRGIFADKAIEPFSKILLRDLIVSVCRISDLAENMADALNIALVKRLI